MLPLNVLHHPNLTQSIPPPPPKPHSEHPSSSSSSSLFSFLLPHPASAPGRYAKLGPSRTSISHLPIVSNSLQIFQEKEATMRDNKFDGNTFLLCMQLAPEMIKLGCFPLGESLVIPMKVHIPPAPDCTK